MYHESSVHQLISIAYDICNAFDWKWHKGLLYKVRCMGIDGKCLKLLKLFVESFSSNRNQRVVPNSQAFSWADVKAGVTRINARSFIFPYLLDDLFENLKSTVTVFADDTSILHVV